MLPGERKVTELEGLRGLLALWVLVGHWATSVPVSMRPFQQDLWNVQAVDVFIALSGFVIAKLVYELREPFLPYIIRRLLRIYPLYLCLLLVSALLLTYSLGVLTAGPPGEMLATRLEIMAQTQSRFWPDMGLHLLMLHGLVPIATDPQAAYAFIGQAWSVSLEWQFYLLAPLLLSPFAPGGVRIGRLVLVGALVGGLLLLAPFMGAAFLGNKLPLFALGIGSYFVWRASPNGWPRVWPWAAWLGLLAIAAVGLRLGGMSRALGPAVWLSMMLCLLLPGQPQRAICAMLNLRPIQVLGRISYSLYLVHFLVLLGAIDLVSHLWPDRAGLSAYFGVLALTIIGSILAAWLLNRWVEQPGMQLGRRWARRITPRG